MKIQLKIAIILGCFYGMQTRATESVYKGTPLNADEWISKLEIQKKIISQIEMYKNAPQFEQMLVASKIVLESVNNQPTAGQLGYYIIQPTQPAEFSWKTLALAGIPVTGLLGLLIGYKSHK